MLRGMWSVIRAALAKDPATVERSSKYRDPEWSYEQLLRGPAYRLLRTYNWLLGARLGLTLLLGKLLGSRVPVLRSPAVSQEVYVVVGRYIQELLVANLVVLGALLVRGPWAQGVSELLRVLARRQWPAGAAAVEPRYSQGALFVIRVAVIAPIFMLTALLLVERQVVRFLQLGTILLSITLAMIGSSAVVGLAAVHVRRNVPKHAVWVWFGLWLIPEAFRSIVPGLPTPRSLVSAVVDLASFDWGWS